MGNALLITVVPEELLGFSTVFSRGKHGRAVPIETQRGRGREQALRDGAFLLVPVRLADVLELPAEPRRSGWQLDRAVLKNHDARVRREIERFVNAKLKQLDGMARSGWYVLKKARVRVTALEHVPQDLGERRRVRRRRGATEG